MVPPASATAPDPRERQRRGRSRGASAETRASRATGGARVATSGCASSCAADATRCPPEERDHRLFARPARLRARLEKTEAGRELARTPLRPRGRSRHHGLEESRARQQHSLRARTRGRTPTKRIPRRRDPCRAVLRGRRSWFRERSRSATRRSTPARSWRPPRFGRGTTSPAIGPHRTRDPFATTPSLIRRISMARFRPLVPRRRPWTKASARGSDRPATSRDRRVQNDAPPGARGRRKLYDALGISRARRPMARRFRAKTRGAPAVSLACDHRRHVRLRRAAANNTSAAGRPRRICWTRVGDPAKVSFSTVDAGRGALEPRACDLTNH
jgi:hypothetical protein